MTVATRNNRGSIDPFQSVGLDAFVRQIFTPEIAPTSTFGVDVYEDADHLYIDAELPGFTREQLDLTIDDGTLTITAERPAPEPIFATSTPTTEATQDGADNGSTGPKWHVRERRAARMRRSFSLPRTIDAASIEAKLNDGVLRLTLGKRAEAKPRKITVG